MSYYNPYLDDLKDERIEILKEKLIGDTKHIYAILHRKDINTCPNCSSIHTISYGKRKKFINCDLFSHYKISFVLEYRRFQCKDCNHVFNDSINIVLKNERITKSTKVNILLDLKEDHTFKNIAKKNNVSLQTVIDIFDAFINPPRKTLPEVICIDEFKNLRTADGKYAFLILDPLAHKIVDVLKDRKTEHLEKYFYSIPLEERKMVKYKE